MTNSDSVQLFENQRIRAAWDAERELITYCSQLKMLAVERI